MVERLIWYPCHILLSIWKCGVVHCQLGTQKLTEVYEIYPELTGEVLTNDIHIIFLVYGSRDLQQIIKIAIWGWQTPQLPRPEKAPKIPRTYVEQHVKTYICTKLGGFNLNKSIGCLRLINPTIINQNHPTWPTPTPPHPCTPTPHPTSNPTAQHGLIDFPVAHHVSHCETVYAPFQLHGWASTTTKVP